MIGLAQSVALALGGVGFSSPLLALRGRIVLGLGGGKAIHDDVAVSAAPVGDVAVSAAAHGDVAVSAAPVGDVAVSGATLDDVETSGAVAGDEGC